MDAESAISASSWILHRPVLGSLSLESVRRPESAFKGLKAAVTSSQDRACCTHTEGYPRFPIPDFRPIGAPFPVPGRIGKRGLPDSRFRPNRESGVTVPAPFPDQIGNGRNGKWGIPGRTARRARSRSGYVNDAPRVPLLGHHTPRWIPRQDAIDWRLRHTPTDQSCFLFLKRWFARAVFFLKPF